MEFIDQQNVRPWQGTFLGIINIISLASAAIVVMVLMFGSSFIAGMAQDPTFSFIFGAGALAIIMFALPFIVLEVFVTIGVFKGQKWAIIIMLIFTIIALIGGMGSLFSGNSNYNYFGSFVFNAFMLYCEIFSLKNPFYK